MRKGFTLHHNGPPANCIGQAHSRCEAFWRSVRRFHMEDQGWSDIAYSFGVCPHGVPFVGRGWDKRQFANGSDEVGTDNGDDSEWYSLLLFVGGDDSTNNNEPPTPAMVTTARNLVAEGRRTGRCGLAVKPHSDWKRKPCPGPEGTELARAWDGVPFGAPPIPRPDLEDDDMFLYSTTEKPARPVMFCAGGKSVGLNEATDLATFGANEIKHLRLDGDTYDAFLRSYPRV